MKQGGRKIARTFNYLNMFFMCSPLKMVSFFLKNLGFEEDWDGWIYLEASRVLPYGSLVKAQTSSPKEEKMQDMEIYRLVLLFRYFFWGVLLNGLLGMMFFSMVL